MVKLDLCQALQHHRRTVFITGFTSTSCSKLEEQTPPSNKPAEEEVVGNSPREEGREGEAPPMPPESPLLESSQHGSNRLPSASQPGSTACPPHQNDSKGCHPCGD